MAQSTVIFLQKVLEVAQNPKNTSARTQLQQDTAALIKQMSTGSRTTALQTLQDLELLVYAIPYIQITEPIAHQLANIADQTINNSHAADSRGLSLAYLLAAYVDNRGRTIYPLFQATTKDRPYARRPRLLHFPLVTDESVKATYAYRALRRRLATAGYLGRMVQMGAIITHIRHRLVGSPPCYPAP